MNNEEGISNILCIQSLIYDILHVTCIRDQLYIMVYIHEEKWKNYKPIMCVYVGIYMYLPPKIMNIALVMSFFLT